MKLLLDECVPRRLKRDFHQHEASTVIEAGFQGLKNGRLLQSAASAGYEVLITVDQNLTYQRNLKTLPLAVLVLIAPHNKYELLALLVPRPLRHYKIFASAKSCAFSQIFQIDQLVYREKKFSNNPDHISGLLENK